MASKLWTYAPVQTAAKSFVAGVAVVGGLWTFSKVSKLVLGNSQDAANRALADQGLHGLQDPVLLESMARLTVFRRFSEDTFDRIYVSLLRAERIHMSAYSGKSTMNASRAYAIRTAFQKSIEHVRTFRAVIEKRMSTALEDFDEVAVDLNARVDQLCTDAVQDYLL
jgi:hypothetical protein